MVTENDRFKNVAERLNRRRVTPLMRGLCEQVADWPYSTFHRYVTRDEMGIDWGGGEIINSGELYGE